MSNSCQSSIRSLSVRFSPGHQVEWHQHEWSQLIYATDGTMRIEADGEMWLVPTRRAIWVPAGIRHRIAMQGSVHLQTIYLNQDLHHFGLQGSAVVNVPPLLHELIIEVCKRSVVEADTVENTTLIRFFNQQLKRLSSVPLSIRMPVDERARRFANRLLSNPGSRIELRRLAILSGTSLRTIQRLFKDELGLTVSQWRTKARMMSAIELLESGKTVTDVGLDLGFENPSAFICAFRKFFGETPGRFRVN